ncbi:MAG: hypothetical protein AAGT88_05085 [Dethiobacter sp.]
MKTYPKRRISTYAWPVIAVALTVSMVLYPEDAFAAAVKGLDVWWNIIWQKTIQMSWLFVCLTICLILLGLSLGALRRIKIIFWR